MFPCDGNMLHVILYGSEVWLTQRNAAKASKILQPLQHETDRWITGAFKGSLTQLTHHDANTTPYLAKAAKRNLKFLLKRLLAPPPHPTRTFIEAAITNNTTKHKNPIQDAIQSHVLRDIIGTEQMETIWPHPNPPWTAPLGSLHNLNLKKDEAQKEVTNQILEEQDKNSILLFMDGSLTEEGAGAAATAGDTEKSLTIGPRKNISNYETELTGILLALQIANWEQLKRPLSDVAIFGDNTSALKATHKPPTNSTGQHLIIKIKALAYGLNQRTAV